MYILVRSEYKIYWRLTRIDVVDILVKPIPQIIVLSWFNCEVVKFIMECCFLLFIFITYLEIFTMARARIIVKQIIK